MPYKKGMATTVSRTPKIVHLAERIVADIRRRRLGPGDAYLNTAGTAKMLGVSTTSANRAMQLLVQRNLLYRRQRSGTVIAAPVQDGSASPLRRVHLLVHRRFLQTEGLLADGILLGIQGTMPRADLRIDFLPPGEEQVFVRQRVAEALSSPEPEGFVLFRASVEVQRELANSGLPAVLAGVRFPSIDGLPCIDRDQAFMGRMLTDYLLGQGARWLLVLVRERMLHGDHQLFDAVRDALAAARLPADAFTLRCVPDDVAYVAAEVAMALAAHRGKGGILCRGTPQADMAAAALADLGKSLPLAVCDVYDMPGVKKPYPYPRPLMTSAERGAIIGHMLIDLVQGRRPAVEQVSVPVALEIPDARKGDR